MEIADSYRRFVHWSDENPLYIGCCPDLYFGGVCHARMISLRPVMPRTAKKPLTIP